MTGVELLKKWLGIISPSKTCTDLDKNIVRNAFEAVKKEYEDRNKGVIKMTKKYEMFKENETDTLCRIRAIRDFSDVKTGDIGGYIEKEENLSHEGDCWVYDDAVVSGNAKVYDDAVICDKSVVSEDARVYDKAMIYDEAMVYGSARVYENARVFGFANIYDLAKVCGNAMVKKEAFVYESAIVYGRSTISDQSEVRGDAVLKDAVLYGRSIICNNG